MSEEKDKIEEPTEDPKIEILSDKAQKAEDKGTNFDDKTKELEDKIAKLEQEKKALAELQKGKDQQLNQTKQSYEELESRLIKESNKNEVYRMLSNDQLPAKVKDTLMADIDSLTPENYSTYKEKLVGIFEAAKEEYKSQAADVVNNRPSHKLPEDFEDKMKAAKSADNPIAELKRLAEESGIAG